MLVVVNVQQSPWSVVVICVPQRRVQSLDHFLIFVHNLPHWNETNIRMFADDKNLDTAVTHCGRRATEDGFG